MGGVYALAINGNNLFAGIYGQGVFLSSNNGTSWVDINSTDGKFNTYIWALAVGEGYVLAGTQGGIYLSTNNGTIWTSFSSGLTNSFVTSFAVNGTTVFAGTRGNGVWQRPFLDLVRTINTPGSNLTNLNRIKTFSIRAVPSRLSIVFSFTHCERVKVAIYNSAGCAIMSPVDKQFESGTQTFSWDTRTIAPGFYMVKIWTGTNTLVKCFSVIR